MYSKSSTTTKLCLFGDVLMRVCIILSVVLSNLAIQTTMVSANTGTDGSDQDMIENLVVGQTENIGEIPEEENISFADEQFFNRVLMDSNSHIDLQDHISQNLQYEWNDFKMISNGYMVRNQKSAGSDLLQGIETDVEITQSEKSYEYDETSGLLMTFYDNQGFNPPAFATVDCESINFDWEEGVPYVGMPDNYFSVRWYGKLINNEIAEPEEFTFTSTSDDGVRLWIDGNLIIDAWYFQEATAYTGVFTLEPGVAYDFVFEYFEDTLRSSVKLEMESASISKRLMTGDDFLKVDLQSMQSTFTFSKESTLADGQDSVTVELTLDNIDEILLDENIFVKIKGKHDFIDGNLVSETQWVQIDESGTSGVYEFELSSYEPGTKILDAKIGNFPIDMISTYDFFLADYHSGLKAEYFPNMILEEPSYATLDNQVIDFDWGIYPPIDGMPADYFSIRWTGFIQSDFTETYTFYTLSDDGIRLWVDGNLLIESWIPQGPTYYSGQFDMIAGHKYDIVVEYYEDAVGAVVGLEWESASVPREVITRNNLFMPWIDIYDYDIDFSETEIVANGEDSTQISVNMTDYIDEPLSGEEVQVQVSGQGNYIDDVLLEDGEWVLLNEIGTTGVYVGELKSTEKGIKNIKFKIRDLLLDDEYSVRFVEEEIIYPECEITTSFDGEQDIRTLTVEENTSCKLIPGSYDIDYVYVNGNLYPESENFYNETTGEYYSNYVEIIADIVEISETGLISADGMGYESGEGPGAPIDGDDENTPGGGGYGGYGGDGYLVGGDPYFGNMIDPGDTSLYAGSGGGGPYGGAGGGIISITANSLSNDGEINADGENGDNYRNNLYSGGGSGGSIFINAEVIDNNGIITANGGNSFENCIDIECGGGGSGGRILIQTDSEYYTLYSNIHSLGGNGNVSNQAGAAGTVLFDQISRDNWDKFLYIRNNNLKGKFTTIAPDVFNEIDAIFAKEKGRILIPGTNHLGEEVTCVPRLYSINGDNTGEFYFECNIETEGYDIDWRNDADITIASNQFITDEFYVTGKITFIVPSGSPTYEFNQIYIDGGELTFLLNDNQDLVLSPLDIIIEDGSSLNIPNKGGMVTIEIIDGGMSLDGTISVNGTSGSDGGNLELNMYGIDGDGIIQVNGSSSENPGDGGSIEYSILENYFSGSMQAYGGEYGEYAGNPGTIVDEINSSILVDNNGNSGIYTFPEDAYTYNWIDLGSAVELVFAGEGNQLIINEGVYGTGPIMPMLTAEGSLNDPESFIKDNVIINWINYADFEYNVDISKPEIMRNGVDSTTINLNLTNSQGDPLSREDVFIRVSGDGNIINDVTVPDNNWVNLTESEITGTYTAELSSTELGTKHIQYMVGYRFFDTSNIVDAIKMSFIQILLDGEIADPNSEFGKTGEAAPIYKGNPTQISFRVVDEDYTLLDTYNGTATITIDDENAQYPESINIINGIGDAYVVWVESGEQNLSIIGNGYLDAFTGNISVSVIGLALTIADDETYYMDEVRTYLTSDVVIGNNLITVEDSTGLYPGSRILLVKMTGDDAGENELFYIASVSGNEIEIDTTPTLSYLISSGVTQVLLIPSIDSITVQSGGVLTINSWDGTTGGVMYLDVNELLIESGGVVRADKAGFPEGTGPGAGVTSYTAGGYGGEGGSSIYPTTDGKAYGSPTEPFLLGSGGGSPCVVETCTTAIAGPGGGIIKINADSITNNGTLSANGRSGGSDGVSKYGSGGSGGSLWIISNEMTGSGKIQANGGQGAFTWQGYFAASSAGGGRIAIDVMDNQYTGTVEAYTAYNTGRFGGAGSIYWTNEDRLVLDNNNYGTGIYKSGLASGNYNFTTVEMTRRGALNIYGEDSSFNLSETNIIGDANAKIMSEGELVVNGDLFVSAYSLDVQGELIGVANMIVDENRTVDLYSTTPIHSGVQYFDNIEVRGNAKLILHSFDDLDENYANDVPFEIESNNVSIAEYGKVSLDGTGYRYTMIDGNGPGGGTGFSEALTYGVGGAHGGLAGETPDGNTSAEIYGNLQNPVTMGSAGGTASATGYISAGIGGNGGGALHLVVGNLIDIDGVITANGLATSCSGEFRGYVNCTYADPTGGGGAGGSIWIEAEEVDGNGSLIANGGASPDGSGGGGGRVSILTDVIDPDISVSVAGGTGVNEAGHGSVYFGAVDVTSSSAIADPTEVAIGGVAASDVLVSLIATNGHVMPYTSIDVTLVDGSTANLNDDPIELNQTITLVETDMNGELHFDVSATTYGTREFVISVDGTELTDHVVIDFTAGDFEPAYSTLISDPQNVPADGVSTAAIIATANNIDSLPIINVEISLTADGSAVLTQPAGPTNEYGQATGYVSDSIIENVTVEADAWGIPFLNSTTVNFYGTDFVSLIDAPARVTPGQDISLELIVKNNEIYGVENVVVEFTLPGLLIYNNDTSGATPEVNGQVYTWIIPEMLAGEDIRFNVNCSVSASAIDGDTIPLLLSSDSAVVEINPDDNTTESTINVVLGYSFDSSISPIDKSLYIGGEAVYTIEITNSDILPDLYTISVSGLDDFDAELSKSELAISPGETKKATLKIGTETCMTESLVNYTVTVTSDQSGLIQELPATVTLDNSPQIMLDAPANNVISGSQSVLFSWRTDPETTGTLSIFPTDDPGSVQTYTSESGSNHAIQVENLVRNTTYTWHIDAVSACGNGTSADRVVNIGNGIVFSNHNQDITINRDYDQQITVDVQNTDTNPHTLTSSIINPYEDLIVNFVDSGSVDRTITLEPGETASLTLALHAQDAGQQNYVLTANLIADEDTTPIIDNANLNVEVLFEGNYSIVEDVAAYDSVTLAHTYVITNNGQTITDLSLEAIDPTTGLPASVYVTPSLDHAKLETGESIRVVVYPIFSEEDAVNHIAYSSTLHLAKALQDTQSDVPYEIVVQGGGIQKEVTGIASCDNGRNIYTVAITDCEMDFASNNWYCTNRPEVTTTFRTPSFIQFQDVVKLNVYMDFTPTGNAKPHDGVVLFNGHQIMSFNNSLPSGWYTIQVPPDLWNNAMVGTATQRLKIISYHPNPGHYIISTGYDLNVGVGSSMTYACATSQEEAALAVEATYPCNAIKKFNPETDVYEKSVWNMGEIKSLIKSVEYDEDGIPISATICTQGDCGDPIDSRTGVFSFATPDISFKTSAGLLVFQRAYSSGAVEEYSEVGYGWTHNQAERLIFPDSMYGLEDYMIFRDQLGNQHLFKIEEDGTYTPGPGVLASLEAVGDGYTITATDGHVFTFNSIGMILSLEDSLGNAFEYTYDIEGVLQRVSADAGTRYIDFTYNDDIRIETVTDHTGREVNFEYDEDGNLIRSTDLLDQEWTYEYDENHRMTRLFDPTGAESVVTEYDMLGRAQLQYDGEGNLLVHLIYHDDGSVTIVDANGNEETHSYDERGVIENETDQIDRDTAIVYDENFRPTRITNEAGNTLQLEWSEDGRNMLAEIDPAGNRTEYDYDEEGGLSSTTNPSGFTTSFVYEGELLTSQINDKGNGVIYTYTEEGWLESQTDKYGKTTFYTYDEHGQKASLTDQYGYTGTFQYDELGNLVEEINPRGMITRYEYNIAGQIIKVIANYDTARPQNDENLYNLTTTFTYDVFGNRKSKTDTLGNTTEYIYDKVGNLIEVIDTYGYSSEYTYDANGNMLTSTDPLGHLTTYIYDATGRNIYSIDALGVNSSKTVVNIENNTAEAIDADGNKATYYLNELNQVIRIDDPMGHEIIKTYNINGQIVSETDELGRINTNEYDELNRLIKTTDASGAVTETVYDDNGYRVASIDPLGNETTYTYDDMGRVVSTTDPLGHTTSSDYDDDGKLVSTTDAMGRTTTYTYDEWDRKASMTDGAGRTTTYTYDVLDRVVSTSGPTGNTYTSFDALSREISNTDVYGRTSTKTYDDLGRVKTTTDYQENTTTYYYDQASNLLSSVDSQGTTSYEYDALNRQIAVTDPLGNRTRTVYDNLGNVSDTINAKGVVTHYVYDSLQRNVAIIQNYKPDEEADADTNVRVDYTYNAVGNRIYVNDANGHVTEFQYDAANRVTRKIDPIGNTWDYVYDLAGNLTSRTDGNNVTTYFVYDDGGNLLTIDYPDGEADVSFTYNNAGQRVTMTDGIGTTTWNYDELSRVESVNDAYGNEIVYTYDEYGNRTGLQYADGKQVAYDFDSSNRLVEVASWDSLETEYAYDTLGQLTNILRPNGVESTYEYDALGRLTTLKHATDTTDLANYTYTYDEVGNIIHAEENVMGGGSFGPTIQVTVVDTTGELLMGNTVYAYIGDTYSSYSKVTDENGQVSITLPDGIYRFRVDVDGTQFWSGETDHCEIGSCGEVNMTIPEAVLVTVIDSNNNVLADQTVYAYEGETYSSHSGKTDENGQVSLRLTEGEYRFRTDQNGTQFWSAALDEEQCVVPGCTVAEIMVTVPLVVTVQNDLGDPMSNLNVYAYNETTYANISGKTDEYGQVELSLPEGEYRFRADYNGTQFWSAAANHCTIPGYGEVAITVSLPVTVTVSDTSGNLISGVNVYAFIGTTYAGYSKKTDANGEAIFTLPGNDYRFRADFNGTQFWSGTDNTCEIPGCTADAVAVTQPITVTVLDSNGAAQADLNVYAFNGTTYAGYSKKTDANGVAVFTLPLGDYRFRADLNDTQFWSGTGNTCSLPDCGTDQVSVTIPVQVLVLDGENPLASINVYAFNGTTYSGYSKTTTAEGVALFTLPEGDYRFRADYAGKQTFSDDVNHCTIPGCELVSIQLGIEPTATPTMVPTATVAQTATAVWTSTVAESTPSVIVTMAIPTTAVANTNTATAVAENTATLANTDTPEPASTNTPVAVYSDTPTLQATDTVGMISRGQALAKIRLAPLADDSGVFVTVVNSDGTPQNGLNVYAFDGTTYSGKSAVTNESGIASFILAEGTYRFRADLNGTQFWSDTENHCSTTTCTETDITVTKPLSITVVDSDGTAQSGLNVYAFNGVTYAGYSKVTNESGQAVFTLPEGDYRFRADLNGTQFWSGTENHCTLPGCESATVSVTKPISVTVHNSDGTAQSGLNVYAFNGTTYAGYSKVTDENGAAVITLPEGDYRFRADLNGTYFWSAESNHCTLPGCESADVSVTVPLTVSVTDTDGTPQSGIAVYTFNGTTYQGYSKTTDEYGQAVFTLPEGDYRFRADADGTQYWSSETNACTLPGCSAASVTTSKPITVSVVDSFGTAQVGLNVYAFNGGTYAGYSKVSDEYGNAVFYLPAGDYRFRADLNGTQFWSAEENTCTLPGCENMIVTVTLPVTVTVVDTDGTPAAGLNVYAFDGTTYRNYSKVTDENGQVNFSLPVGDYRFRADLNGTQFWSAEENNCTLPGCVTDSVTLTKPVTVTVKGEEGNSYADLNVYAFKWETSTPGWVYAGYSGKTDSGGHVTFTLPQGDYQFRADYDGVQFWSGNENTCTIPGCEEDSVILPGGTGEQEVSIDYTYDALNRLISAEYSNGTAFGYTYDAAGNVLTYAETHYGQTKVTTYTYDAANQLLNAAEDTDDPWYYTYDGNGSLIMSSPEQSEAAGAKRYTYNTALYMTKMEVFDGAEWQVKSEMTYDGLGNRYEVTSYVNGESETTHYVLNNGTPIEEISNGNSIFYLYGKGLVGNLDESWTYILEDGFGATRQEISEEGEVLFSVSYTPWGDTLDAYGSAVNNIMNMGGIYDPSSGLIYIGNGQYYDPSTGRFLTRGTKAEQNNPYSPWSSDPVGMLFAPIALIFMLFNRNSKKEDVYKIFKYLLSILLIVCTLMMIGMFISSPVLAYDGIDDPSGEQDPLYEEFNDWFILMGGPTLPFNIQNDLVLEFCATHVGNKFPDIEFYPGSDTLRDAAINSCMDPIWDVPLYPDSYFKRHPHWVDMDSDPDAVNWYLPKASDMKRLYDKFLAEKKASNFTEFFGQMASHEVSGAYGSIYGQKIMQAITIQIWNGGYNGDMWYCNDGPKRCVNGALNWLAIYPESAMRQAGAHLHLGAAIDLKDIPTIDNKKNLYSTTYLIKLGRARAEYIGYKTLWDEDFRMFTGDISQIPYHWGAPPSEGAWWFHIFLAEDQFTHKEMFGTPPIGFNKTEMFWYDPETRGGVYSIEQYSYWKGKAEEKGLTKKYVVKTYWEKYGY